MKKNINLTLMHNSQQDLPEDLLKGYIAENYTFGYKDLEIVDSDNFLKSVKKRFKKSEISLFKHLDGDKYIFENDSSIYLYATYGKKNGYLEFYSKTIKKMEKEFNFIRKFIQEKEEILIARSNFYLSNHLNIKEDFLSLKDFEDIIPEYFPDLDTEEFFNQYFKAEESIFILSGKSGTGKSKFLSYMLKYLLQNKDIIESDDDEFFDEYTMTFRSNVIKLAYVKNENILANDTFWIMLKERGYDLVILDDLDYFLSPREQEVSSDLEVQKDKFISELLSFSDGIVKNKTKFMISTNRYIDSIDEALRRPGRLFAVFSFGDLTQEQALVIWKKNKLKEKDFYKEFDTDFVLPALLGSKIHSYLKNDGKPVKSFIKKGSKIDISDKFKHSKKVGFKA